MFAFKTSSRQRRSYHPALEHLEDRTVPTVLEVALVTDGLSDNVIARRSGANVDVVVNGDLIHRVAANLVSLVRIRGSGDIDRLTVFGDLGVPVTFDGRAGADSLTVLGTPAADGVAVGTNAVTINITRIQFSDVSNVTVNTGAGNDAVSVTGTSASVTTTINGESGDDQFFIGGGNYARTIQSLMTLEGGDGEDELILDDTAASDAKNTYTLTDTTFNKKASKDNTLTFADIENVALNTSSKVNTVTVEGTLALTTVNTGPLADTLVVTPTAQDLGRAGKLTANLGSGDDEVIVHDRNNPYDGGQFNKLYDIYANDEQRYKELNIHGDIFRLAVGVRVNSADKIRLYTGNDSDIIQIHRGGVTVKAGLGADTFVVSPTTQDLATTANLDLDGEGGTDDQVILHDQNNAKEWTGTPEQYFITQDKLTRNYQLPGQPIILPLSIKYRHTEGLTLHASDTLNVFNVHGTPGNTTIEGGAGIDNFQIGASLRGLDLIKDKLTLHGGGGANPLTIDDVNATPLGFDHYYVLDYEDSKLKLNVNFAPKIEADGLVGAILNTTQRSDNITIQNTGVPMTIAAGGGDDRIQIRSVGAQANVQGGLGNDTITVANPGRALADALGGMLNVQGGADSDTLNVSDQGASAGDTYTLRSTAIDVPSRMLLEYGTFDQLNLTLSNRNDVLDITSNPYPTIVTVNGGNGIDTLTGSNAVNLFIIQGLDSGLHTYGTTFYNSFENLLGDSGIDLFVFQGGSVSGTITGQGGTDTLNYAAWSTPVSVSLPEGRATAVGGGAPNKVSGIENVIGGAGADELIGDDQANALSGGGGADTLTGGGGPDLLIGGPGADVLWGGEGEDLLIGGSVIVTDPVEYGRSLSGLRDRWARTDLSYDARVALLRNDLNSATVLDDLELDELWGQVNRDWFWALPEEIRDHDPLFPELIG